MRLEWRKATVASLIGLNKLTISRMIVVDLSRFKIDNCICNLD
jgi:hypothetical protein